MHFLFGKLIVAGEFCKNLEVVAVVVEEISGNTIGFSVFDFIGIKGKIISGTGFAFGVDSVAIVGVERNFVAFGKKIPFSVVSKNMEFKSIMERKTFGAFVFPDAADISFIFETIAVLSIKSYVFSCFGIIRFCFRKILATGKKKHKTEKNKNYFFQENCALSCSL